MDNNELEHIVDGIMYKINSYNLSLRDKEIIVKKISDRCNVYKYYQF